MKKILVCALAAVALTLTSCDQTKKETTTAEVTEAVESQDLTSALKDALEKKDAASIQTAVEAAQAEIDKLQADGKIDQAKEALKSLQAWLTENAETVKGIVGDNAVVNGFLDKVGAINIDSIAVPAGVEKATEAVNDAKAAIDDAKAKAEEVQETVEDVKAAVEDVKTATEDVKEAAKDAKEKIDAAKDLLKKK
ncbi:MAG: hypothetical protein IKH26_10290 [Bacteroidaceae bacterium]|nr:hypothetical protein [Bacteroidaceae bacterium]